MTHPESHPKKETEKDDFNAWAGLPPFQMGVAAKGRSKVPLNRDWIEIVRIVILPGAEVQARGMATSL